ncbi:hypothetical protein GWI33_015037 [Rhynchophorus ferrugineus]|uniref:Uncharacterized protein n=1 Tax=Rhynchophorus ferrugineus TaxID=354439 RepID=A0A834MBT3_RHYFE|nr:hypothetical protein GWI33_015037 [Rhynchophorus ferrugineus]
MTMIGLKLAASAEPGRMRRRHREPPPPLPPLLPSSSPWLGRSRPVCGRPGRREHALRAPLPGGRRRRRRQAVRHQPPVLTSVATFSVLVWFSCLFCPSPIDGTNFGQYGFCK